MNPKPLLSALALAAALFSPAAPAHGPDGDHQHGPAASAAPSTGRPRIEASSEQFELVATLDGGRLSMLVDRFATNEPVLNAQVEVESGGRKARAAFHADTGDYMVTDEALLKLLGTPGQHALVITLIHGNESDLLDASLQVTAEQLRAAAEAAHDHADADHPGHEHSSASRRLWTGVAVAAAVLVAIAAWRRRAAGKTWNGGQP